MTKSILLRFVLLVVGCAAVAHAYDAETRALSVAVGAAQKRRRAARGVGAGRVVAAVTRS